MYTHTYTLHTHTISYTSMCHVLTYTLYTHKHSHAHRTQCTGMLIHHYTHSCTLCSYTPSHNSIYTHTYTPHPRTLTHHYAYTHIMLVQTCTRALNSYTDLLSHIPLCIHCYTHRSDMQNSRLHAHTPLQIHTLIHTTLVHTFIHSHIHTLTPRLCTTSYIITHLRIHTLYTDAYTLISLHICQ